MNKQVNIVKKKTQKKHTYNTDKLNIKRQHDILCALYMNFDEINNITGFPHRDVHEVHKEIKNKINCYKQQDVKKGCYDENYFISIEKTYEKLVSSKLLCYYCKNYTHIIYNNIREDNQWTLDRIDNNQGHNKDNCVICCLKCNLERRVINSDKFKFTKQMKIKKIDDS